MLNPDFSWLFVSVDVSSALLFSFSFFKVIARMQVLDFGPYYPVLVNELDSTK